MAPDVEFLSQAAAPGLEALPVRYGWPTQNERGYRIKEQLCGTERPLRVIALGAGCSGICLAKFLPERLRNVSLTIYDKNPEFGGTWYENRYPGCACDIPSHIYQVRMREMLSITLLSNNPSVFMGEKPVVVSILLGRDRNPTILQGCC